MSILNLHDWQTGGLRGLRRRIWIAIFVCLLFRAGDAAFQENSRPAFLQSNVGQAAVSSPWASPKGIHR